MTLPEDVLLCLRRLNEAGYTAYVVGGCVRDSLLGLTPNDYDMCTAATPEEISRIFSDFPQVHNGEKHGTVGVILHKQVYELTTFRMEGNYEDSRHPGWVKFVSHVEQDLARRDFTVNAMAYSPEQGLIDPFGGQQDLHDHILRAVGEPETRFREDALRILRGVRFAVRFSLNPDKATEDAMVRCAPLMEHLAAERIFEEMCKLITLADAEDLLRFCPVITQVIPELKESVGFQQHTPYHKFDVFTHVAHVVQTVPNTLALRWAALLHDVGKPATYSLDEAGRGHFKGHAGVSAQIADRVLLRLKAPTKLREQTVFLIAHHMVTWEPDKRLLRRRLGKYGPDAVQDLIALQIADFLSKGTGARLEDTYFPELKILLSQLLDEDACLTVKDLKLTGRDLISAGFPPCPGMGKCLSWLLNQVQDELLPNEKTALLAAAAEHKEEFL